MKLLQMAAPASKGEALEVLAEIRRAVEAGDLPAFVVVGKLAGRRGLWVAGMPHDEAVGELAIATAKLAASVE